MFENHSTLSRYLLNTYYVEDTILGSGGLMMDGGRDRPLRPQLLMGQDAEAPSGEGPIGVAELFWLPACSYPPLLGPDAGKCLWEGLWCPFCSFLVLPGLGGEAGQPVLAVGP